MADDAPFRKGKEPMIYLSIRHTVADYATWRPAFDASESFRRANGATGVYQVYRDQANPNEITTVHEWDNAENAQKFAHNPALAELMKTAGVTSAPEARFLTRA
jgi:quinol monooxygenase YgiN